MDIYQRVGSVSSVTDRPEPVSITANLVKQLGATLIDSAERHHMEHQHFTIKHRYWCLRAQDFCNAFIMEFSNMFQNRSSCPGFPRSVHGHFERRVHRGLDMRFKVERRLNLSERQGSPLPKGRLLGGRHSNQARIEVLVSIRSAQTISCCALERSWDVYNVRFVEKLPE